MAKSTSSFAEFNKLIKEIEQGQIKPVYLLHGEEYYFLEKILESLENKILDDSTRNFNHHLFYGKDSSVNEIVSVARRFPMMADRQLLVVKEAQHLRDAEGISEYLARPVESTVLVWYHPAKNLPMNRKPGTDFKKHYIYTADAMKERDVPAVIQEYLKELGYDIEPKSLHLLIEYSAAKLSRIISELEKVFANVPPGNKIRETHIQDFVGINKEYNVFALQTALAQRDKIKTIEIVRFMADNINTNPLPLLIATLFAFFRKVAVLQTMHGKSDKELMGILGLSFYGITDVRNATRKYNALQVEKAVQYLHEADLKFKGIMENTGDEKAILQETLVKILSL